MSTSDSELEFTSDKVSKSKSKNKKKNKHKINPNNNPPVSATATVPVLPVDIDEEILSSSEDSSSDDAGYGKQQALGIDPMEVRNYDGVSVPLNGSQYLLSVIKETKKSPKVVVADHLCKNGSSYKSKPVNYLDRFKKEINCDLLLKLKESNPYLPTQEWRDEKVKDFSILRSKVEQLRGLILTGATRITPGDNFKMPEAGNRVVWQRFCFGLKFEEVALTRPKESNLEPIITTYFNDLKIESDKVIKPQIPETPVVNEDSLTCESNSLATTTDSEVLSEPGKNGCRPLMSLMLLFPQQQIIQLVYYQSEWIDKYGFINKCQGEWLYALLTCLEKPLEPSSMADIRMICKSLIIIRNDFISKLGNDDCKATSSTVDDEVKENNETKTVDMKNLNVESDASCLEYINSLNLFIYLIADYFSQKDLVTELY